MCNRAFHLVKCVCLLIFSVLLCATHALGSTRGDSDTEGRFFARSAKIRLRPPAVTLYQFDAVCPLLVGAVQLKGATAHCSKAECTFTETALFPCPHDAPGLSIWASDIRLSGHVIYLQSPRLKINSTPILGLPRLKLVPDTQVGFLPPVIGWSPVYGMRLGPRVHLPLSSHRYVRAHAAWRTRQGMDSGIVVAGQDGTTALNHLQQSSRSLFDLKMDEQFSPHVGNIALKTHLASNRTAISALSFYPRDRAVHRTDSLFKIGVDHRAYAIAHQLRYAQWFPNDTDVSHGGQIHLGMSFYPLLSSVPQLQPSMQAALDRYVWTTDFGIENTTRFQVLPAVTIPVRAFIFSGDIRMGVLAQRYQTDSTGAGESRLLPAVMVHAGAPFVKRGTRAMHVIRPSATLRLAAFQSGTPPRVPQDYFDAATEGTHLILALENTLTPNHSASEISFEPSVHWRSLSSTPSLTAPSYAIATALKRAWIAVTGRVSLQANRKRVNDATVAVDVHDKSAVGVGTALYYSAANADAGAGLFAATSEYWPLRLPGGLDGYTLWHQQLRLKLTSWIRLSVHAHFELNPGITLSALTYQLEMSTKCRCLTASLSAAHRPKRLVPDTLLNISWHPGK